MEPKAIKRPIQLLVEGKDDCNFFAAFRDHLRISKKSMQIQNYGGLTELHTFLPVFVRPRHGRAHTSPRRMTLTFLWA